jgi:hypothetical protein
MLDELEVTEESEDAQPLFESFQMSSASPPAPKVASMFELGKSSFTQQQRLERKQEIFQGDR